jgi:hypothetical protein
MVLATRKGNKNITDTQITVNINPIDVVSCNASFSGPPAAQQTPNERSADTMECETQSPTCACGRRDGVPKNKAAPEEPELLR